jgi:hypothetical protein
MKPIRSLLLLPILLHAAGCAHSPAPGTAAAKAPPPLAPPPPTALETLAGFAGEFAAAVPAAKAATCKKLRAQMKAEPKSDARLRLLLAQAVAPACGDFGNYRSILDAAMAASGEAGLKAFLRYQKSLLARLDREMDQHRALERRLSQTGVREKQTHRRLQSQESELRGLQRKLEALKSIEHSLDEPND